MNKKIIFFLLTVCTSLTMNAKHTAAITNGNVKSKPLKSSVATKNDSPTTIKSTTTTKSIEFSIRPILRHKSIGRFWWKYVYIFIDFFVFNSPIPIG